MRSSIQVSFLFSVILLSLSGWQQILAQSDEAFSSPLNDECEQAIALSPGDSVSSSTTDVVLEKNSTHIDLLQCSGEEIFEIGTPGLWYTYEADTSRVLRVSTCAEETNFANRITTFTLGGEKGDCSSRSCAYSSMEVDPLCLNENATVLEFSTVPGTTYAIYVHGQDSASTGDFGLSMTDISPPPGSASCNAAEELPQNTTVQGTTVGASVTGGLQCERRIEGGPQNPGVFYYIPPVTVRSGISLALAGGDVPFEIRVYEGPSCDELTCKTNIDTDSEDLVAYASWLAEVDEDFYVYVSAADDGDDDVTDRFGILMVQQEIASSEDDDPSSAVMVSYISLTTVLLLTWSSL
jgi:hypothetical protein